MLMPHLYTPGIVVNEKSILQFATQACNVIMLQKYNVTKKLHNNQYFIAIH